jgi:hypothetical protein
MLAVAKKEGGALSARGERKLAGIRERSVALIGAKRAKGAKAKKEKQKREWAMQEKEGYRRR